MKKSPLGKLGSSPSKATVGRRLTILLASAGLLTVCGSSAAASKATTTTSSPSGAKKTSSTTTAHSNKSTTTAPPNTVGVGPLKIACPSAAAVSSAAGSSYTSSQQHPGPGTLDCQYNGAAGSGNTLSVLVSPSGGISTTQFQAIGSDEAKAQKTLAVPLSGVGEAAYVFSIPSGDLSTATSFLSVLINSETVTFSGPATITALRALASATIG